MTVGLLEVKIPDGGAELIPSLAVRKGSPVRVKDGKYHPFRIDGRNVPAIELFSSLAERYGTVHFMDLDGISDRDPDLDLLKDICSGSTSIIADLGVAYSEMVIDVIMAGASDAVISTKSILSLDEIASAYELTENIIVELVLEGRSIVAQDPQIARMDPASFISEMAVLGLNRIILVQSDPKAQSTLDSVKSVREAISKGGELYVDIATVDEASDFGGKARGVILSASKIVGGLG
jgi:phosphoribosylformimino-5-aminoimidazole carboxamide ribonucleotide (ProFAR) isomerase